MGSEIPARVAGTPRLCRIARAALEPPVGLHCGGRREAGDGRREMGRRRRAVGGARRAVGGARREAGGGKGGLREGRDA